MRVARALEERKSAGIRAAILSGHPFGPGRWRERWHLGGKGGTLRAGVFGVSDGLVSNLALILGVAGGGVDNGIVILAGVAGLLAGAFSMASGEYLSMRVQRELFEHMLEVEAMELKLIPDAERRELAEIYIARGIPESTAHEVAASVMMDPDKALDVHAREELGLDPDELGSPWGAAGSSFATFAVGAMVPLLPYVISSGTAAFALALGAGAAAMASVGAFMAWLTRRPIVRGAARMTAIGTSTALVTFAIGTLLGVAVS